MLVDAENIWRNLGRGLPLPGENSVGIDDFLRGVSHIRNTFFRKGFCVVVFVFLPPHYCRLSRLEQTSKFVLIYCPTNSQAGYRYNTADSKIVRLAQIISLSNSLLTIEGSFQFLSDSFITKRSQFLNNQLIVFWHDGNDYFVRRKRKERIRRVLRYFWENRHRVKEVCLLSGDSDFCTIVKNLQRKGIRVTVCAEPSLSLSGKLTSWADNFIPFPLQSSAKKTVNLPTRE